MLRYKLLKEHIVFEYTYYLFVLQLCVTSPGAFVIRYASGSIGVLLGIFIFIRVILGVMYIELMFKIEMKPELQSEFLTIDSARKKSELKKKGFMTKNKFKCVCINV